MDQTSLANGIDSPSLTASCRAKGGTRTTTSGKRGILIECYDNWSGFRKDGVFSSAWPGSGWENRISPVCQWLCLLAGHVLKRPASPVVSACVRLAGADRTYMLYPVKTQAIWRQRLASDKISRAGRFSRRFSRSALIWPWLGFGWPYRYNRPSTSAAGKTCLTS